jgi:hypothetical protein
VDSSKTSKPSGGSTGALPGGFRLGKPWIGIGYDENYFREFKHTAGDQPNIDRFEGGESVGGIGIDVGLSNKLWSIWAARHACTLRFRQHYSMLSPYSELGGDLKGSFYDFGIGHRFGHSYWKNYVEVIGGVTWAWDELTYDDVQMSNGMPSVLDSRTLKTWKSNLGLAIDRPVGSGFDLRLGAQYTTGWKSGDADEHFRLSVGLRYNPSF